MSGPAEAEVSEILSQMQQDEQQDDLQSRDAGKKKTKKDKTPRAGPVQLDGSWNGSLTSQIDPSILPPMPTASSIMTSYNNPISYHHQYTTASNDIRNALAAASSNRSGLSSRRNNDHNSGNIAVEQPHFQSNMSQNAFPHLRRVSGPDAGSAFDHVDAPDNYLGEGASKNNSYSLGGGMPDSQYFESLLQSGFGNDTATNINVIQRSPDGDALEDDDDDGADEMPIDLDSSYDDPLDSVTAPPAQTSGKSGRGTGKPRGRRPKIPYTGAMPRDSVEYVKLKKENHKNVEKKRRETINDGIKMLAEHLPKPDKNKSKIIMQAVEYIEDLRREKDGYIDKWTAEKLMQDGLYKLVVQERDALQQTLARRDAQIEDLKRLLSELTSRR